MWSRGPRWWRRWAIAPPEQPPVEGHGSRGVPVTLEVDGEAHELCVHPGETLLEVLRERLDRFGTKAACERAECGTCTVLVGDRRVMACAVLAGTVREPVTTVEGLADDLADRLRRAFADTAGFQCGFCTPGHVVSAYGLLRSNSAPTRREVEIAMAGNLCRCTGYQQILEAVKRVADGR